MASWKDGVGQYTWGTYLNTGTYNDIAVVGGAKGGGSDYFGIPESEMDTLRAKDYGTGVHFWRDGDKLNITINLIIISTKNDTILRNGYYIGNSSADYKFFANIQYKNKQGNWVELGDKEINTFYGGDPMYDKAGWDTKGSGYLWKTFTFDNIDLSQVSQFSVGVHGEGNEIRKWNYYNIEDVLPIGYKLTIEYRDEVTNQELKTKKVYEVLKGSVYRDTAPEISGYIPKQKNFSFTVNDNMIYVVWYNRQPKVILNYYIKGTSTPIKASDSYTVTANSTYTATAPSNINEYTLEGDKVVTLNIRNTDVTHNFYYTRISYIKPWAIRNGGRWKSLQSLNRSFRIRRGGSMVSPSNELIDSSFVGRENYSSSRIRKSNRWVAQGKIGE